MKNIEIEVNIPGKSFKIGQTTLQLSELLTDAEFMDFTAETKENSLELKYSENVGYKEDTRLLIHKEAIRLLNFVESLNLRNYFDIYPAPKKETDSSVMIYGQFNGQIYK